MDFRQIEAFVKVVELASFSKAASLLHISQPSVSAYIAALEKELDAVLLNRSTRTLSTTLAGERFLHNAKKMLALKQETLNLLKNLSEDVSGEIRILASSTPAQYILPGLLAGFHRLYPKISFRVRQADTAEVVEGIAAHKGDIGFAGSVLGEKKCDFFEFTSERLVLIGPADSAFVRKKTYTLAELLSGADFIAREFGSGTRIQYEKFFSERAVALDQIKTCATMDSTQSIVNAVAGGLGISIVSELAARPSIEAGDVLEMKLEAPLPTRKMYAVLGKNIAHSHLTRLLMQHILPKDGWETSPANS